MEEDDDFLTDRSRQRAVPSGRLSRLGTFGRLAGGVAGNVIGEGARRLAAGERPRGLVLDRHGAITVLARGSLVSRNSGPLPLSVPRRGEDPKQLRELDAAGVTEAGDWLIMDRDERQIHRYSQSN